MSAPAPLAEAAAPTRWWVEAEGRAWGPYPAERLARFRDEGRLDAASLVSLRREGPFQAAALEPHLAHLFPQVPPAPEDAEVAEGARAAERPLLVISDGEEHALAALDSALSGHGAVVRLRPGLWLLRAREDAAALRNTLSRRLGGGGALLVVEAPLGAAAWFNLDGDTDRALRRLWAEPADGDDLT